MRRAIIFILLLSLGCSGNADFVKVNGSLKSSHPTELSIPSSPTPTVTILGRSAEEFPVEFVADTLDAPISTFTIDDVPTKQPVVFEISHPTFDPAISFPFDLTKTSVVALPALKAGTTSLIVDSIEVITGDGSVDPLAGMILGQLSSEGTTGTGCTSITSVEIRDKESGTTVAVIGPFYFNTAGNVVNSGVFADSQCSYVMANVLAGNYILNFLDGSLQTIKSTEVVVLQGALAFGMDVP